MITIDKLCVRFGKIRAVDDLSLSIKKGESILLAGANGAGKTSLLRAMAGVLGASHGSIRYGGRKADHRSRRKIAYIPASISLYDGMTREGSDAAARPFLRPLPGLGRQRTDPSPRPKSRLPVQGRKNHFLPVARPGRGPRIPFRRRRGPFSRPPSARSFSDRHPAPHRGKAADRDHGLAVGLRDRRHPRTGAGHGKREDHPG